VDDIIYFGVLGDLFCDFPLVTQSGGMIFASSRKCVQNSISISILADQKNKSSIFIFSTIYIVVTNPFHTEVGNVPKIFNIYTAQF